MWASQRVSVWGAGELPHHKIWNLLPFETQLSLLKCLIMYNTPTSHYRKTETFRGRKATLSLVFFVVGYRPFPNCSIDVTAADHCNVLQLYIHSLSGCIFNIADACMRRWNVFPQYQFIIVITVMVIFKYYALKCKTECDNLRLQEIF